MEQHHGDEGEKGIEKKVDDGVDCHQTVNDGRGWQDAAGEKQQKCNYPVSG